MSNSPVNECSSHLVSVLIRTFNRPQSLAKAVGSVIEQTHRPLEIVLVNDGGLEVDPKLKLLAEEQQVAFHLINFTKNRGRSHAGNAALEKAQGEALLFLDDDDWLAADHIANLLPVLKANPQLVAVYSDTACVVSAADLTIQKTYDYEFDPLRLAYENYLPIHSVLFVNNELSQACEFNPELDVYEDWNFWLQLTAKGSMQRVAGVTAWYSAQLSGIGFGAARKDFSDEVAKFFKATMPFYSAEQISVMFFMCRNFFEVAQNNKLNESVITSLQTSLFENNKINYLLTSLENTSKKQLEQQQLVEGELNQIKESLIAIQLDQKLQQNKLNNYLGVIKGFFDKKKGLMRFSLINKIVRKSNTLFKLIKRGDFIGIRYRFYRDVNNVSKKIVDTCFKIKKNKDLQQIELISNSDGITILCTSHTLFVARLLKQYLQSLGIAVNGVSNEEPDQYDNSLHIVICAQLFERLPARYWVFQMEQSVSSRWFNAEYFSVLNNAEVVLDYSKVNLAYLQKQGIPFSKLYYVPVSNLPLNVLPPIPVVEPVYDVVFYGDVNNSRRQRFLEEISRQFKTLVVSEVFGEALYKQLKQARVLVNIHYYEGALLETTRIYEALSLGMNIVSESSIDIADHALLEPWVSFTPVGDIAAMLQAIQTKLDSPQNLTEIPEDLAGAHFHLGRALVGSGLLNPLSTHQFPSVLSKQELQQPLCLSMPESFQRHAEFKARHPEVTLFHGLRFNVGWVGCALSYSYLAQQALKQGYKHLEVWEDDIVISSAALKRWQIAKKLFIKLEGTENSCDLLSGLLADVSDATQVLDYFEEEGTTYVIIDRMISAVCNFYGEKPLAFMEKWDCTLHDVYSNTMDRYLEKQFLRVLVPLPFIAGHNPEQDSTLWGCQNSQYDTMIAASEAKLYEKLKHFKQLRISNGGVS